MPFEHELGTLIRRMNPYTNGTRRTMLFVSVGGALADAAAGVAPTNAASVNAATHAANAVQAAKDAIEAAKQAVAARDRARDAAAAAARARRGRGRGQAAGGPAPADAANQARDAAHEAIAAAEAALDAAADAADPLIDLSHIDLVVDDFIANYSHADWVFRGQPQTVKRALRITYRYPFIDDPPKLLPGPYATEHILIGYAGGNSSG